MATAHCTNACASWTRWQQNASIRATQGWARMATRASDQDMNAATLAEPGCDFYAATFERLFRVLVHADARVVETACEACGAAECRFEVRW